ncbi:hypothetical protein BZA05DRAFT_472984 [Tricharina praecox]|uniref:uncharacterized protein n=1 Tax=Tricharina praecox TaxID=43433 RepID=UPI00221F004C|nr:uncharacterized protein BZA05DRAFT_472984 [Tricharina praecox]KAI5854372.1 hypothetical protein BZA05DRAFT_472984 [Tricharina praecox]
MPVPFLRVVELLEAIEALQSNHSLPPTKVKTLVKALIYRWFSSNRCDIDGDPKTVLAIQSTLQPALRPDRVYMLREEGLAKAVTKALCIAGTGRGNDLAQWRTCGDLGEAVRRVMRGVDCEGGKVTVGQVDELLDKLAARSHFSNKELARRVRTDQLAPPAELLELFNQLSSVEGKWLTRCILKSLAPVRMPETITLQAYHFLLPKLYMVQDNLEKACQQICDERLTKACPIAQPDPNKYQDWLEKSISFVKPVAGVKVGRGEFVKATSTAHAIQLAGNRKMMMERKYDGEYCQIHIDLTKSPNNWIKIFSKSGKDSTQDRVGLHEAIYRALKIDMDDEREFKEKCILEGEMVVYCDREKKIMPFHYIRSHVSRSGVYIGSANDGIPRSASSHVMILLFDILLMDGTSLLNHSLTSRLERLERVLVEPQEGYCQQIERTKIDFSINKEAAGQRLRRYFARAILNRWEGCVLKPCDAPYFNFLGTRPDKSSRGYGFYGTENAWVKLKKDYIVGLGDTADFAIVGGVSDHKRAATVKQAAGSLNSFHAAVLLNKQDVKMYGAKPQLKVVFEVTYSITQADLSWIQKCAYFDAIPYKPGAPLEQFDLLFPSELSLTKPTHIFSHPLVFEICGGSFDRQTNCGFFTPRHPRVSKVHWDREFSDALSFDELQLLAHDALHGAHGGSQQERLWIAKLERGDVGEQIEETPQNSTRRGDEVTPSVTGSLAPGTPKRARHVFSLTPEDGARKRKTGSGVKRDEGTQDASPLRKKQHRRDSVSGCTNLTGLFAKSFIEYTANDTSLSQRSSVPDSQPPAANDHSQSQRSSVPDSQPTFVTKAEPAATNPPSQPDVCASPISRLHLHGVSVIDEFRPAAPVVPAYGSIILVDELRPRYTCALVEFLEEKKRERPKGEEGWGVWEWRAAEMKVGVTGRAWEGWWIWDI